MLLVSYQNQHYNVNVILTFFMMTLSTCRLATHHYAIWLQRVVIHVILISLLGWVNNIRNSKTVSFPSVYFGNT